MTTRRIVVDGVPVRVCGVGPGWNADDEQKMTEILRAAIQKIAQEPPEDDPAAPPATTGE